MCSIICLKTGSHAFKCCLKATHAAILVDGRVLDPEPRHAAACQAIWKRMADAGDIYLDNYGGWYAVRDEAFYAEGELTKKPDGTRVAPTGAEVDKTINALAQGGQVVMPAAATFFSERFGMVADKFGITWMVLVPTKE